jgi:hypothetical protein
MGVTMSVLNARPYPHDLSKNGIRAFVIAVGFPSTLEEADEFVRRDDGPDGIDADPMTLVDVVLADAEIDGVTNWSSPRWARPGDIAFFYCTKRSLSSARSLLKKAKASPRCDERLVRFLLYSSDLLIDFHGSIFAYGRCSSIPQREPASDGAYWGDLHYVDIGGLTVVPEPIDHDTLGEFMMIRRAATITPLRAAQARTLVDLVKEMGSHPRWIEGLSFGHTHADGVLFPTWRAAARDPDLRFDNEEEVRSLLIDGLLSEVADEFLEECDCQADRDSLGVADYMVRIGNDWIPVEAKLLSVGEVDRRQALRYAGSRTFRPRIGRTRGERQRDIGSICVVIDSRGIDVVEVRSGQSIRWSDWLTVGRMSRDEIREVLSSTD